MAISSILILSLLLFTCCIIYSASNQNITVTSSICLLLVLSICLCIYFKMNWWKESFQIGGNSQTGGRQIELPSPEPENKQIGGAQPILQSKAPIEHQPKVQFEENDQQGGGEENEQQGGGEENNQQGYEEIQLGGREYNQLDGVEKVSGIREFFRKVSTSASELLSK